MTLFGIDMPGIIAGAMGSLMIDGTLVKVTNGSRNSSDLAAGKSQTTTNYSFKGMVEDYEDGDIDGQLIQDGDRKVLILAGTLTSGIKPAIGDSTTIEGETRKIVRIERDPAAATYSCQVR